MLTAVVIAPFVRFSRFLFSFPAEFVYVVNAFFSFRFLQQYSSPVAAFIFRLNYVW